MTGVNMIHVPYRGGSAVLTDLLSGQVQVYFGVTPSSVEYIRAGKLRALAVTTGAHEADHWYADCCARAARGHTLIVLHARRDWHETSPP
jgi:hypothetical protein